MASNPYYQRAFGALAGTLARARQMVNEFTLIQQGFDLIGNFTSATKYQLACSDLTSDLEINPEAGYFRAQRQLTMIEVRASLIQASAAGTVSITIMVNDVALLSTPLTLDAGERTSTTAATLNQLAITAIPDDSEFVISIDSPGESAKGLIVSFIGTITTAAP